MKKLTKKEAEFALLVATLGNAEEAAYKAGFTVLPGRKAQKLLQRQQIKDEIARQKELRKNLSVAVTGLQRIAFGSVADAIKLATDFEKSVDTSSLDLFSISEIKYQVGKGIEIKFYDRLKALQQLLELESVNTESKGLSIYEALERSAGGEWRLDE